MVLKTGGADGDTNVHSQEAKRHTIVKRLGGYISTWLYSEGAPPDSINDAFLRWMDKGLVPTSSELTLAIRQSDEMLARRRVDLS